MKFQISSYESDIAIVVVGYNRIKSLSRLLDSLVHAKYDADNVPLVISIDCSGDEELYTYVRDFEWPHGDKHVNIQKERLGLKEHIYQCGDLTRFFKAIVLFEDDIVASPVFYSYVQQVLEKYSEIDEIAEISLYKNERNGYVGLPFYNLPDGNDVFLMQDVSTWGQCWTKKMWQSFIEWRDSHTEEDIQNVDMPDLIKSWTRAWSKYFNAYVVDTDKYVLYPNVALSTNFNDAGEHGRGQESAVQVCLQQEDFKYRLPEYSNLTKYDIYFNNVSIPKWCGYQEESICCDVYGYRKQFNNKNYLLSPNKLPFGVISSWGLKMKPIELNIKYNIKGAGLYLYDVHKKTNDKGAPVFTLYNYFLDYLGPKVVAKYFISSLRTWAKMFIAKILK